MSLEDEIKLLRNIPMFAKVDAAKLKLLAFTSERLSFRKGDILFHQGETGEAAYLIISGSADVLVENDHGSIVVAHLQRNSIVGEIAMLCDVPRTATVQASEPLEVLKISRDVFFRLMKDFPDMAVEIMRELAQRLDATTRQLREARAK
ncbi:MAG: cyclic nucleotide-binding domain-containing protein [Rhodovibrionaceae bacterium]|nr:cyclic nucleotide-binding domain-containing protein [Rhodovibrionaceae bacterium]